MRSQTHFTCLDENLPPPTSSLLFMNFGYFQTGYQFTDSLLSQSQTYSHIYSHMLGPHWHLNLRPRISCCSCYTFFFDWSTQRLVLFGPLSIINSSLQLFLTFPVRINGSLVCVSNMFSAYFDNWIQFSKTSWSTYLMPGMVLNAREYKTSRRAGVPFCGRQ